MRRTLTALALASLALAGCAASEAAKIPDTYATSGFEIHQVDPRYYDAEAKPVDLNDPETTIDENGAVVWHHKTTGEQHFHPVAAAQYGLHALAAYDREGTPEYLRRAVANANALLEHAEERDGAMWFPYPFDFALGGVAEDTIEAPWYSGMAQGQALSLFVRLHEHDGQQKWRDAADKTFQSFQVAPREDGPWVTLIEDGNLWFEEYAGNTDPLLVINGHNFALFGLYDYHISTGSERAEQLFDAGATTVRNVFDLYRVPGGMSHYCVQEQRCLDEDGWPSKNYHSIHIMQLEMLADITQDSVFDEQAATLREDFYDPTL